MVNAKLDMDSWIKILIIAFTFKTEKYIEARNHHNYHHTKIEALPEWTDLAHFVNESRMVPCGGINETRVRWMSPEGDVIENTSGRVHVEEWSEGQQALVFEHIESKDKGNWNCLTENGSVIKHFTMVIHSKIKFTNAPEIQMGVEGNQTIIRCVVEGDPIPVILWYFNGQPISIPDVRYIKHPDHLIIKKTFRNDSGEYTCKAFQDSKSITAMNETTIRLNVGYKPEPLRKMESVEIAYGYIHGMVNLTCAAIAEPVANFSWYRGNELLSPEIYVIHAHEHLSILQLFINDSTTFGKYKCNAKNAHGEVNRLIELKNGTKPDAPQNMILRGGNSDFLYIDVGAKQPPKPNELMGIIGYRFQIMSLPDYKQANGQWDSAHVMDLGIEDGITYYINNLSSNTTYLIRVASRNLAGISDWLGPEEFRTKSKEPYGLPPSKAFHGKLCEFSANFYIFVLACFHTGVLRFIHKQ